MRSFLSLLSLAAALASARCTSKCSGTCLQAVVGIADGGAEPFCSAWLGLAPVTTTVVVSETATSSVERVETATTVLTRVSTVTTSVPTVTVYVRRDTSARSAAVDDVQESVLAQCVGLPAKVSSACSCVVSSPPATVTVLQTSTGVANFEHVSTETVTVTTDEVAVATATPVHIIPEQPIVNADFESRSESDATGILPWVASSTMNGRVEYITGVNPCSTTLGCAGGSHVVRIYPPTSGASKYTSISQRFDARPSTKYNFSFWYRCLNFSAASTVDVWYNNVQIGSATCGGTFLVASDMSFTTDATGSGTIDVRLVNGDFSPYLYIYADAFYARPA